MQPHLHTLAGDTVYRRLSERFGRAEATLRSDLHRLRLRYLQILREELRREAGPLPKEEELACLRQIISCSGAL